ncbi:MAG: WD40 repeat domain-containing protein, partial [Myxococcales bacterium]|nr:WD40 repeat domain-containing protein [Myxococcales bacterium]
MELTLIDRYCASPHSAALTAAAMDPDSGARITADAGGTVAITKPGEAYPGILFDMGCPVRGAAAVCPGGALAAVGDDDGTVAVYKTWDGSCAFEDTKEGAGGKARAMRALAFHPQGNVLASLSIDGIIRIFDIQRWERLANYQGYSGETLQFDARGERLLVIDTLGQPKLLDLMTQEQLDLHMVPGGVRMAHFTRDGRHVVAMGQSGITLMALPDGRVLNSFSARGSSGMLGMVMSPEGDAIAAVTGRSVHRFSLPQLDPEGSKKHGAPAATNAAIWGHQGVLVGSKDGSLHRPGAPPSLEPVVCCTGFGEHRVAAHGDRLAVWTNGSQMHPFNGGRRFVEVSVDRDGRVVAALPGGEEGVQVFDARTGRHLFDAGPETADTPRMEVGGSVVGCMMSRGGLRWYDLSANNVLELPWVSTFALSGSGTWLGVVTPKGQIRILDPGTGEDALPPPEPTADVPVRMLSFVNRRPDLLALDAEGVLSIYDLTPSAKEQMPAKGRDVLDLNVEVDRLWGITGGTLAAVRFQNRDANTATIIYVDLDSCEVVSEVPDLLPYAWVDPESGRILQPARGAAILELDRHGREERVLRALPEGEWIAFTDGQVLAASAGAQH